VNWAFTQNCFSNRCAPKAPLAPSRYNAAPDPPGAFAAITAITKLTGPFGERCTP